VDVSAISSMKSAAKSDIYCELQNYANHWNLERNLHLGVTPLGTLVWVSIKNQSKNSFFFFWDIDSGVVLFNASSV